MSKPFQCWVCERTFDTIDERDAHAVKCEARKAKLTPKPQPGIQPGTQNRDPQNIITR